MTVRFADLAKAKDGGWHPEIIKTAIRLRGMTLTKLALDNDLPEGSCRVALIRPHTEADRVIAEFLGVSLCELWPSRYDENGHVIRHERDNTSFVRDGTHRLIARAG